MGVRPSDDASYALTWYRIKRGGERVLNSGDLRKYLTALAPLCDATEANLAHAFMLCIERLYLERAIEMRRLHPQLEALWTGQLGERVSGQTEKKGEKYRPNSSH